MKQFFAPLWLFVILLIGHLVESETTSINGIVYAEKNQSTRSLASSNIILIIQNDIHHIKLNINQTSFPFTFNITDIHAIKHTAPHRLSLLIFAHSHRLLWETTLFRQILTVNHPNMITFIVKDVSNLPKCLSEGYPCMETNGVNNPFISECCSKTKCSRSTITNLLTCGGHPPAIQSVKTIYFIPANILPTLGLLDQHFLETTESIYQSISASGTIVKVNNATIGSSSTHLHRADEFILEIDLSLSSAELCEKCLHQTIHSIKNKAMPFNIPQQDGSSLILALPNHDVYTSEERTTKVTSTTIITSTITATTITTAEILTDSSNVAESSMDTTELPTTIATSGTDRGTWALTGNMTYSRYGHTASVILNGSVLVVGGYDGRDALSSAELYDPQTGIWTLTGNMTYSRYGHTASLLQNGSVLVVGGVGTGSSSAELYDPQTGIWTLTGNMTYSRYAHTASLLQNGSVLVVGGVGTGSSSAEVYDPQTGIWTLTGNMTYSRYEHTASVILNGLVLVVGGYDGRDALSSAELYDPQTGIWTLTGNMTYSRYGHTASLLQNGSVLVVGGVDTGSSSAELYDPQTGIWTLTGNMTYSRYGHTASVILNGLVLVVGGYDGRDALSSAELYDPQIGTWRLTGSMAYSRIGHTASVLLNESVLVAGGLSDLGFLFTAELYEI